MCGGWNRRHRREFDVLVQTGIQATVHAEAIMGENTRMHDGIAGAVVLLGTLLGYLLSPYWLLVPGVIGALMLQSAFSGFCPVYFTLGKTRGTSQTG